MKYIGTLLKGQNTFDYLNGTLLVRPDPRGAVSYMLSEGKSNGDTIAIDGHPTEYNGASAIFVDDLYHLFQGTFVSTSDSEHRVDAMLIHSRSASPVTGGVSADAVAARPRKRIKRIAPQK